VKAYTGPADDDDTTYRPYNALQTQLSTLIGKLQLVHNTIRPDGGHAQLPPRKKGDIIRQNLQHISATLPATKEAAAAFDLERSRDKTAQEDAATEAALRKQRQSNSNPKKKRKTAPAPTPQQDALRRVTIAAMQAATPTQINPTTGLTISPLTKHEEKSTPSQMLWKNCPSRKLTKHLNGKTFSTALPSRTQYAPC
jgi:hypothetical protein